jgi:hypothetical protein
VDGVDGIGGGVVAPIKWVDQTECMKGIDDDDLQPPTIWFDK